MDEKEDYPSGNVEKLVDALLNGLDIRDRRYRLRSYKSCFRGDEAVKFMVAEGFAAEPEDAVALGNKLMALKVIQHVSDSMLPFKNDYYFYRFTVGDLQGSGRFYIDDEAPEEEANADMNEIIEFLRAVLEIKSRSFRLKSYENCFVASDAVKLMIDNDFAVNEYDAVRLGNILLNQGIFHHVERDHEFKNEYLFFRFAEDEVKGDHGKRKGHATGSPVSWSDWIQPVSENRGGDFQPEFDEKDDMAADVLDDDLKHELEKLEVFPLDEHNAKLLDCTHPKDWINPEPKPKYNLVVIGAGTAGLVTAVIAAGLGATVALIEQNLMGGDCLNVGCVPSKALIKCAKVAHEVMNCEEYGVHVDGEVRVEFSEVMERLRRMRASIAPHDSAERYADLGVDVFFGHGRFVSKSKVEVGLSVLEFSKAVIATGATAAVPAIPGIDEVPYFTNANIFNLEQLPPRMIVIGSGPIGCELAQSFLRFGSQVTLLNRSDRILGKEDPDAIEIIKNRFMEEGMILHLGVAFDCVELIRPPNPEEGDPFGCVQISYFHNGEMIKLEAEALLIFTGRKPRVGALNLVQIGVAYDRTGIVVTDQLQTTQKNIYAVGDCCTAFKFTHVADFMARTVIRNTLFFGRDKFSSLLIPWATYTEPEVAHVGLYPRDMVARDIEFDTFVKHFDDNDRSILEGNTEGFVKIHTKKGSDKILGATIVGATAGDMIAEISVAMQAGMGLSALAYVIHSYPTEAESVRQCGDLYNKTRLTPFVKSLFRNLMSSQR